MVNGAPTGRHPCATMGWISARGRWAPTAPWVTTRSSRKSRLCRSASPPLAIPPMTIAPGALEFRWASRSPAGNVNGSHSIRCTPSGLGPNR